MLAPRPSPRLAIVAADLARAMRAHLPSQTDAAVFAVLGISKNTWVKVREGRAIRYSTALRLVGRYAARTGIAAPPTDFLRECDDPIAVGAGRGVPPRPVPASTLA